MNTYFADGLLRNFLPTGASTFLENKEFGGKRFKSNPKEMVDIMDFWRNSRTLGVTVAFVSLVSFAQAATVTGIVTTADKDAKPIAGATVVVPITFSWDNQTFSAPVKTEIDGKFTITIPDTPEYKEAAQKFGVPIYVFAPGYGFSQANYKAGTPLVVTLAKERFLQGIVEDVAGKPVSDAVVTLDGIILDAGSRSVFSKVPTPWESLLSTKTDAKGHWQLKGIPQSFPISDIVGDISQQKTKAYISLKDPRFIPGSLLVVLSDATTPTNITLVGRVGGGITGTCGRGR